MIVAEKRSDPRVKRTRKLLQEAFMELFMEKGFASISIQDITDRATVNRATFYAHFSDKYALLDSVTREGFQQHVAQRLPEKPTWDQQSVRALVGAVFDFLGMLHHECKPSDAQFDPMMEQAVQQETAEILLGWFKQPGMTNMRRRVQVETVASVMSWSIFGTAVQWSRSERKITMDEMINEVLQVIIEGAAHLVGPF